MIFVCVGSREYPFNRLFEELDRLVESTSFDVQVFAQIGTSSYLPKYIQFERFMDRESFNKHQSEAQLIISHAGAGALIGALKKGKKVISVPRLEKYGEHIDDHQLQISRMLADEGYLREVIDMSLLGQTVLEALQSPSLRPYVSQSRIEGIIRDFLA